MGTLAPGHSMPDAAIESGISSRKEMAMNYSVQKNEMDQCLQPRDANSSRYIATDPASRSRRYHSSSV